MRELILAAGLALAANSALAADPIEGEWLASGGSARVAIAPCAANPERVCGTISWLRRPNDKSGRPLTDTANPNPGLRSRPLVGLAMLSGFRRAGADRWTGGKIYDPDDGKSYDSKLQLLPDGRLKVDGCILFICRGQTWRRPS